MPDVRIDLTAFMKYAREKGVKAGELTNEEKNKFIIPSRKGKEIDTVQKSC